MPETPDFEQIARRLLIDRGHVQGGPLPDIRLAIADQLRQVWNARGAADVAAVFPGGDGPPCQTFSESEHDADQCKHCGWTCERHGAAESIRSLDR